MQQALTTQGKRTCHPSPSYLNGFTKNKNIADPAVGRVFACRSHSAFSACDGGCQSTRFAAALVLLGLIAGLVVSGCSQSKAASSGAQASGTSGKASDSNAAQQAPPVPVATATKQDVPVTGEWVATTDGYVNAQIQPQVSGYLIRQDYKEGGVVRRGQVLFEIDPRPWQATLDQARGQLAQAQAQLELARINVNRDTPLAREQAIAQSQLDNEVQTAKADEATVKSAQASVESAELNLGFTKVRSLIDGTAGQAAIQVGSLVNTSSVLTSVSQLNPLKVYFYISEQEYLALSARARSRGKSDLLSSGSTIPLKLTLADNKVYPQNGRIVFVDRSVTTQTGSLRIAASFPNPSNLLRPGQFGWVAAQTDTLQQAVLVPQRAINDLQGQNQIYVVQQDNTIKIKPIQLGPQLGPQIVVTSGLQGGERVVTEGMDKLKDGMKVQPQAGNAGSQTTAPKLEGN